MGGGGGRWPPAAPGARIGAVSGVSIVPTVSTVSVVSIVSIWAAAAVLLVTATACRPEPAEPPAVGTLERERIELVADEREAILEIPSVEGAHVTAGDLVVALDDRRLSAQLAGAEAARDAAAAGLAELVRGTRRQEVEEARARLREAESAVAEAEPELARTRDLLAKGVESRRNAEHAEAALGEARARRDAARSVLTRLLEGATPEQLDQAQARLAEAAAGAEEVHLRRERMSVRAPRPAVIDALPFEVGERPPPGATVAVLLADGAPYARVHLPAALRPAVHPGAAARVRVEGVERVFAGRVRWVSGEASFTPFFALTERDRSRLSYLAEVDLTEPEARALPTGLAVEVRFERSAPAPAPGDG